MLNVIVVIYLTEAKSYCLILYKHFYKHNYSELNLCLDSFVV